MALVSISNSDPNPNPSDLPDPAGTSDAGVSDPNTPSPPARPDGLADDYWSDKGPAFDKITADLKDLTERRAAETARQADVPEDLAGYEIALPEDFKVPDGMKFEVNESDPLVGPAREFAKKHGLTKAGFKDLVALQLQGQQAENEATAVAVKAELAKLGTKGTQIVDALTRELQGMLGNEAANALLPMLFTAKQVRALETLAKAAKGAGLSFNASGREGGQPTDIPDEEWDAMSDSQKLAASRKLREGAR